MKKLLYTFLCVFMLILMLVSFSSAASYKTGKYRVSAGAVTVLDSASLMAQKTGEVAKNTYIEITEIKGSFGYCEMKDTGISGWVFLSELTYVSEKAESKVTGLKITSKPKTTVYTEDEDTLDITGLKVSAVYSDGTTKQITGYEVYCPSFSTHGKKTVTVRYLPDGSSTAVTASFTVTVNKVPLKSISVSSKPNKTVYKENEALDLTGLVLTATYTDGRAKKSFTLNQILNDPDFTITTCHNEKQGTKLKAGTHTINISYKYSDIKTSFTVSVSERKITSLTIKTMPDSLTVYYNTLVPTLDGMVLTAKYDNGETEEISARKCEIICTPSDFVIGDGNKVKVKYEGLSVTVTLRYSPLEADGLTLSLPPVLTFIKGEEIDLSSMKVYLKYNSGKTEEITDYKVSEIDNLTTGVQNVVVSYKEFSEVFSVFVTAVYSKGDVSGDGLIRSEDARTILRAAVGLTSLEGKRFTAGDIDRNNKITSADARLALRAAVGLENFFKKK